MNTRSSSAAFVRAKAAAVKLCCCTKSRVSVLAISVPVSVPKEPATCPDVAPCAGRTVLPLLSKSGSMGGVGGAGGCTPSLQPEVHLEVSLPAWHSQTLGPAPRRGL